MDGVATRVNGSMLPASQGQVVCLAGRVVAGAGSGELTLEVSDKTIVKVSGCPGIDVDASPFLEIVGKAEGPGLTYFSHTAFGASFDLDNYNEMVLLANHAEFRHLMANRG